MALNPSDALNTQTMTIWWANNLAKCAKCEHASLTASHYLGFARVSPHHT